MTTHTQTRQDANTAQALRQLPAADSQTVELIDRLSRYYHSDFVTVNMPWVQGTPFADWLRRQLLDRGIVLQRPS